MTGAEGEEGTLSRASSTSELSAPTKTRQKETMTVNEVLAFCLPAGKQHAPTTNLLYLLADNGPLFDKHSYLSCVCGPCQKIITKRRKTDELCGAFFKGEIYDGETLNEAWGDWLCKKCQTHMSTHLHMRAGFRGKAISNDLQVSQMAKQVEKDDILDAYHRNNDGSTPEEQSQFIALIKREKNVKEACRNISKEEIIDVFSEYASGPGKLDHPMSYYDARLAIRAHRACRRKLLGLMYGENKKNSKRAPRPKPVPHAPREGEVPGGLKLSMEMRKCFGRQEDMRLQHGHLFELAGLQDQNVTGITSNVRLLRNLNRETNTWSNNF